MNAKRAKALRREARAAGYNPEDTSMQAGLYRDGTESNRLVRSPDSGRNVYQQLKKLEK